MRRIFKKVKSFFNLFLLLPQNKSDLLERHALDSQAPTLCYAHIAVVVRHDIDP
jgi:hypothetical protein